MQALLHDFFTSSRELNQDLCPENVDHMFKAMSNCRFGDTEIMTIKLFRNKNNRSNEKASEAKMIYLAKLAENIFCGLLNSFPVGTQ